jgi:regulator of sigma E protease
VPDPSTGFFEYFLQGNRRCNHFGFQFFNTVATGLQAMLSVTPIFMRERSVLLSPRFWGFLGFFLLVVIPLGIFRGFGAAFFGAITLLEVVLLFNLLIIVHELGHFLAARWRGLKVEKFAIWFGKPIWKKTVDGVEYILGSIPAGGYVALPQMAPMETIEGKTDTPKEELPPASPGDKIIVAFAGPLFSLLLALFFATIVWVVGKPTTYMDNTTIVGCARSGGPAYMAGIRDGDVIKSIDGHPVRRWTGVPDGVVWRIITSTQGAIPIVVERDGQEKEFSVTPQADPDTKPPHWWQRSVPPKIEIAAAEKSILIGKVDDNSPAAMAGLREGDQLTALGGAPLLSFAQIQYALKDHPYAPMHLAVRRGGATWNVTLQPVKPVFPTTVEPGVPPTDIGIEEKGDADVLMVHPAPWLQVSESANAVRGTLAALLARHSNVSASQLSGPVGIMNIFYVVLSSENGWRLALWLAVLINVNLAMLNLFPLPVLDGGHILLSIIEWIRRRPLSMAILEPLQTVCAVLLIGFMLYVTVFDAQDSGRIALGGGSDEVKFAPPVKP